MEERTGEGRNLGGRRQPGQLGPGWLGCGPYTRENPKTKCLALRDWRTTNPEVERHKDNKDSYSWNKDCQSSPRETSVVRNGEMVHAKLVEKVPQGPLMVKAKAEAPVSS
ncbi:hypothetical protein B0H13DRAFT_1890648 [Mycena leptocephala]|nr:hypothetical protein B0H13DRAFT_1890648 [Mycena leptocephala]